MKFNELIYKEFRIIVSSLHFRLSDVMSDPPAQDVKEAEPGCVPDSGAAPGLPSSLLQSLVFLNWVQFPPLPRVPDLSDPGSFLTRDSDTCAACHLYISVPRVTVGLGNG